MYKIKNYHKNIDAYFTCYENDLISDHIKNGKIWEPHLHEIFEKYINKNSVVLEAGAHIGSHTLKLALLSKKVYCFEPLNQSYELLKENIENNSIDNIILSKYGLSDKIEKSYFNWIMESNKGYAGIFPIKRPDYIPELEKKIDVELISIDSLNLDQLDFIKLDVEGYEEKVIIGGINTIKKFKPIIALECWKDYFGSVDIFYTYKKYKMLIDMNYTMKYIKDCDFLFIPKEKNEINK